MSWATAVDGLVPDTVVAAEPTAATTAGAGLAQPDPIPPPGLEAKSRLGEPDLAAKKEGLYATGLPLVNFNSDTGFGYGARAYLYQNGERDDPFFAYTQFRHRWFAQFFQTTRGFRYHWVDWEAPYAFDSMYRLHAALIYEENLLANYFGIGESTMAPLRHPEGATTYGRLADYDAELRRVGPDGTTLARYDQYHLRRPWLEAWAQRDLARGRMRLLGGMRVASVQVMTLEGESVEIDQRKATVARSRLAEDARRGLLIGADGGWDNLLRAAMAWDTRDFEPDPNRGVFCDAVVEWSDRALGSAYRWGRAAVGARGYWSPFPEVDLVAAARLHYTVNFGDVPFYDLNLIPSSDGANEGLGGLRTLRGFAASRFVGPVALLGNAELRWTVGSVAIWRQTFALILASFADTGRVYDAVHRTTLRGLKVSGGGAARVAWNQATIVVADFGMSSEGTGLYVDFGHIF